MRLLSLSLYSTPFTNTEILPAASPGSSSSSIVTFSPTVIFLISLIEISELSLYTLKSSVPSCRITLPALVSM